MTENLKHDREFEQVLRSFLDQLQEEILDIKQGNRPDEWVTGSGPVGDEEGLTRLLGEEFLVSGNVSSKNGVIISMDIMFTGPTCFYRTGKYIPIQYSRPVPPGPDHTESITIAHGE